MLKYVLQNIHDNDKARAFRRNILHERGPLLINLCKCNGNDDTKYQNHLAVKTFNMHKKTIINNEIANDIKCEFLKINLCKCLKTIALVQSYRAQMKITILFRLQN